MAKRRAEDPSRFPLGVAIAALVVGLALFFANTVPALREQQGLASEEQRFEQLRRQHEAAIQRAAIGGGARLDYDLQSLLVAIDQQGYTPLELAVAFPARGAGDDAAEAPR